MAFQRSCEFIVPVCAIRNETGKFLSAVAAINPPGDQVEKANLGEIEIKEKFRGQPHGGGWQRKTGWGGKEV